MSAVTHGAVYIRSTVFSSTYRRRGLYILIHLPETCPGAADSARDQTAIGLVTK
jgi:hypothetical protein